MIDYSSTGHDNGCRCAYCMTSDKCWGQALNDGLALRMLDAGYKWDGEEYRREISRVTRTVRKAYAKTQVGDRHIIVTYRLVDDNTGKSRHERRYIRLPAPARPAASPRAVALAGDAGLTKHQEQ